MSKAIRWYEKIAFDAPRLNSPQPCIHGAGCVYTVKNAEGFVSPGSCRYVHPGEEGNGRRLFPSRTLKKNGIDIYQPACVRLTGNAGYYERRRLGLSWQAWCAQKGIPYTPNKAGEHHMPVKRIGFGTTLTAPVEKATSLEDIAAIVKDAQDTETPSVIML